MKHRHCYCHLDDQIKRFKAGKLGLLGIFLIVGHLLFHVAECLLLPVIIASFAHHDAEAVTELSDIELNETTFDFNPSQLEILHDNFFQTLERNQLLK